MRNKLLLCLLVLTIVSDAQAYKSKVIIHKELTSENIAASVAENICIQQNTHEATVNSGNLISGDYLTQLLNNAINAEQNYSNKHTIKALHIFDETINLAREHNIPSLEAYLTYRYGKALYESGKKQAGIEQLLYVRELLDGQYGQLPNAGSFLYFLGSVYTDYGDFTSGKYYLSMALQYPFCNEYDHYRTYGMLGSVYYKQRKTDSSLAAIKEALVIAGQLKDTAEIGSMSGNMGVVLLEKGAYVEASNCLRIDYEISKQKKAWESASNALLVQAKAYIKLNDLANGEHVLLQANNIRKLNNTNINNAFQQEYYLLLATISRLKADCDNSFRYTDSFRKYVALQNQDADEFMFKKMELNIAAKMHKTRMKLLDSERQRQVLMRNSIIIVSFFLIIIIIQALYRQRQKQENDKKEYTLKLQHNEQQLKAYQENIRQKSALVNELEKKLTHIINNPEDGIADSNQLEILARLREASLITEEGWTEFTKLVEEVHRHFFIRLKKAHPDLTPSETRLITLIRLDFSGKEMAGMLGISPDSVKKAKQRLRKKLNMPETESLDNVILLI